MAFLGAVLVLLGALLMGIDFLIPMDRIKKFEASLREILGILAWLLLLPIFFVQQRGGIVLMAAKHVAFWLLFGSVLVMAVLVVLLDFQYVVDSVTAALGRVFGNSIANGSGPHGLQWLVIVLVGLPFSFAALVLGAAVAVLVTVTPFFLVWLLVVSYNSLADRTPRHSLGAAGFVIVIAGQVLHVIAAFRSL